MTLINNTKFKALNDERQRCNMLDNLKAMLAIVGIMLALFTVWAITP